MKDRPLLLFTILHIIIFLVVFVSLGQFFYPGPAGLERVVALDILSGQVPYRDFSSEYPPLALLSFLIPALMFRSSLAYAVAFAVEMLAFDLIALLLLKRLAAYFRLSVPGVLGAYTLFLLMVGALLVVRYDMLPAMLVLAAIWAFISGKNKTAWAILALGVMAKIYPVVIAPIFALSHLRQRQYRPFAQGSAAFLIVILALSLPWIVIDANGFLDILRYHVARGVQWESTYASVLLIGNLLGLTRVAGEFSFGSWNIASPLGDSLARLSPYLTVVLLLVGYALYARSVWRKGFTATPELLAQQTVIYSTLAVLLFLLGNKVFSSQFLIWLCPLLALMGGRWRDAEWLMFVIAAAITQYTFPYNYLKFETGEPYMVVLMAIRNGLLVAIAILLMRGRSSWPSLTSRPTDS